jgi:hypothetical protein
MRINACLALSDEGISTAAMSADAVNEDESVSVGRIVVIRSSAVSRCGKPVAKLP